MYVTLLDSGGVVVDTALVDDAVWTANAAAITSQASRYNYDVQASATGYGLSASRTLHSWDAVQAWIASASQWTSARKPSVGPATDPRRVAVDSADTTIDSGDALLSKGDFLGAQAAYQDAGVALTSIPTDSKTAATVGPLELQLQALPPPLAVGDALRAQSLARAIRDAYVAAAQPPAPPGPSTGVVLGALAVGAAVLAGVGVVVWRWLKS